MGVGRLYLSPGGAGTARRCVIFLSFQPAVIKAGSITGEVTKQNKTKEAPKPHVPWHVFTLKNNRGGPGARFKCKEPLPEAPSSIPGTAK
jgi:hypothetical protein